MPPFLAILLALLTRNVLLSLMSAIVVGLFLLNGFSISDTLSAFFSLFAGLLSEGWILKTLGFALFVGAIMELLSASGAIDNFVAYLVEKRSVVTSARGALMLSYIIGVIIFVESSITSLVAGAVGRPLCARYGVSRAKLAFVCDSTSAPVSSLILFNGWGALLLGLLLTQIENTQLNIEATSLLMEAVFFNFYALSALIVTFLVVWFGAFSGGMQQSSLYEHENLAKQKVTASLLWMGIPLGILVGGVFFFLYVSGDGNILKGSGSSAIFYTTLSTLFVMFFLYVPTKKLTLKEYFFTMFRGMAKLFKVALILLFAFAIGKVTTDLQTGIYLASYMHSSLDVLYLGAVVFLVSALISFATGTSWGTFSIMIPIAFPMALSLDANVALVMGAVISGGVFGDHCSPISDTTIISSMASECDVVEHVKTQLPYALLSGVIALVLFIVFSFYS